MLSIANIIFRRHLALYFQHKIILLDLNGQVIESFKPKVELDRGRSWHFNENKKFSRINSKLGQIEIADVNLYTGCVNSS